MSAKIDINERHGSAKVRCTAMETRPLITTVKDYRAEFQLLRCIFLKHKDGRTINALSDVCGYSIGVL
jgi:uncharacterized cysteine cluster protein YcgN (CxxCxxCC family)